MSNFHFHRVAGLEIKCNTQPDGKDVDFEIHCTRVTFADCDLVVDLFDTVVGKTQHSDVQLNSHVVGGEGYQSWGHSDREDFACFVCAAYWAVCSKFCLRTPHADLRFIE